MALTNRSLSRLRLGAIGVVLGAVGVFFTVRFVDKMLHGVSSFDWLTFLGVGVTLGRRTPAGELLAREAGATPPSRAFGHPGRLVSRFSVR